METSGYNTWKIVIFGDGFSYNVVIKITRNDVISAQTKL